MFLAYSTRTALDILFEMDGNDIHYWFIEALKIHGKINPPAE